MACFQTVLSPLSLSNNRILGNNVPMVMDICFHGIQITTWKFNTICTKSNSLKLDSAVLAIETHWCYVQSLHCLHLYNIR